MKLQFGDAMLKIVEEFRDLDYPQLLCVYADHSCDAAFYDDLLLFLRERGNLCGVWVCDMRYTACVRAEPYKDGCLLTCLETAPDCRRCGFAYSLITALLRYLAQQGYRRAYVHVAKKNQASIRLHQKAGFCVISDSACLIDGTVSQNYFTLVKEL